MPWGVRLEEGGQTHGCWGMMELFKPQTTKPGWGPLGLLGWLGGMVVSFLSGGDLEAKPLAGGAQMNTSAALKGRGGPVKSMCCAGVSLSGPSCRQTPQFTAHL